MTGHFTLYDTLASGKNSDDIISSGFPKKYCVRISDRDRSAAQIGHQSDLDFPDDLIGHCSTDRRSLFN